jgi:hypothetical protein
MQCRAQGQISVNWETIPGESKIDASQVLYVLENRKHHYKDPNNFCRLPLGHQNFRIVSEFGGLQIRTNIKASEYAET